MGQFRPDLTISIISANNLLLLLPCLRSVFANTHDIALEVFVVDNASNDGTADAVIAEFPQVKVIRNPQQLGFSTNNNLVLRQGEGRYLMLLNDDTIVLDGAFDTLVRFADTQPRTGAFGVGLLNSDGTEQQSFAAFPQPLTEPFVSASHVAARRCMHSTPFLTDIVSGACLMVRRNVIESVGVLDTAFDPIYSEEFDWCYRIKQAGYEIAVVPEAKVIHYGSFTMNQTMLRKLDLLYGHKVIFFRKHHGATAAWTYKLLLAGTSTVRAGILSLLSFAGDLDKKERAALQWHLARKSIFL